MCDYSLMGVPNRLAVEGEQLVMYKFRTGSLGLASPLDVEPVNPPTEQPRSFWARVISFFNPPEHHSVQAVCIPPGAQLVEDIPASLQQALGSRPDRIGDVYADHGTRQQLWPVRGIRQLPRRSAFQERA